MGECSLPATSAPQVSPRPPKSAGPALPDRSVSDADAGSGADAESDADADADAAPYSVTDKGTLGTLTFDEGASLPPDAIAQWSEQLGETEGWTLSNPDTGHGLWGYTSVEGCAVTYWQGEMFDMAAADDRAASDFVLMSLLGRRAEALGDTAEDGTVGFVVSENRTAAHRYVQSVSPDNSFVVVVHGFAALRAAMYLTVVCPSDRAPQVAEQVVDASAILVIG